MSLHKIKQSYDNLIEAFKSAGITLNESQKESLDTFMLNLESKINETRDTAIRETKRIVESRMEKEYKDVIESIIKNQDALMKISGKLQSKITSLNESKKIADVLDSYISEFVNETIPQKNIIDYTKMKKQQELIESLKDILEVETDEKNEELSKENKYLKEKCAELEDKLNEKECDIEKKPVEEVKEEKEENVEQKEEKIEEVEKTIDEIINQNQDKLEEKCSESENTENSTNEEDGEVECEKNLEEAITEILEGEKASDKKEQKTSDKDAEGQEDTQEMTKEDEEIISESIMQSWISTLDRITPKQ